MSVDMVSLANLKEALQNAKAGNRLSIDIDGKRQVVCQILDVMEEGHELPSSEDDMIEELIQHPLEIQGFKPLSREEAHERK
jgi:RecB family endonuclease NucS